MVGLILLEHVNLNVDDENIALKFYVQGLGCQLNKVASKPNTLVHVNLGVSQFHVPCCRGSSQRLFGTMCISTTEALDIIETRLIHLFGNSSIIDSNKEKLIVQDPFLNRFEIINIPQDDVSIISNLGGHPCGSATVLAMPRVTILCPIGTSNDIAQFYEHLLYARVSKRSNTSCVVHFEGFYPQELVFEEAEGITSMMYDSDPTNQYHIAIYLDSHETFLNVFHQAAKGNLLYVNERFQNGPPQFASSVSLEEANSTGQFRVKDMRNADGDIIFQLEHEIRSPRHRSCPLKAHKNSETSD